MTTLDASLRTLIAETIREVVREELKPLMKDSTTSTTHLMPGSTTSVAGSLAPGSLHTVADVASALHVNEATVRSWIRTGALQATSVGRTYRVQADAIERFLQGGGSRRGTHARPTPEDAAQRILLKMETR